MPRERMPTAKDDLATLAYATPALRTAMAFALYLRFGTHSGRIDDAYAIADEFIARLKADYSE